jgi:hypothetical protein
MTISRYWTGLFLLASKTMTSHLVALYLCTCYYVRELQHMLYKLPQVFSYHTSTHSTRPYHQPINIDTAGALAFLMDYTQGEWANPPRWPSADWWALTTANAAGTNGLTCLPKHGKRTHNLVIYFESRYPQEAIIQNISNLNWFTIFKLFYYYWEWPSIWSVCICACAKGRESDPRTI